MPSHDLSPDPALTCDTAPLSPCVYLSVYLFPYPRHVISTWYHHMLWRYFNSQARLNVLSYSGSHTHPCLRVTSHMRSYLHEHSPAARLSVDSLRLTHTSCHTCISAYPHPCLSVDSSVLVTLLAMLLPAPSYYGNCAAIIDSYCWLIPISICRTSHHYMITIMSRLTCT